MASLGDLRLCVFATHGVASAPLKDADYMMNMIFCMRCEGQLELFFLLDAAWVRSRAERPSVSYTKVTSKVARTGHNLQVTNKFKQQIRGSNKFRKGGREDETDARAERQTHWRGASNEWSPTLCESPPTRRTRSTGQMKRRDEGETRPTSNLKGRPKSKM